MKLLKEIENFELKHKIISFVGIIILTILITRVLVLIKNPDPVILGYELHHFYYGIFLLIIVTIFELFAKKHYRVYLTLSAISIGLILDELLYVAGDFGNIEPYTKTLPSAIVFAVAIGLITIITFYTSKRKSSTKRTKNQKNFK
ncbi:MAG: hypothetical protein WCP89_04400 [archaeon]